MNEDAAKPGTEGGEQRVKKKSLERTGRVDSELSNQERCNNEFLWAKWQGKIDRNISLIDFRKVWTLSHPRVGVGDGEDVGD